MCGLGRITRRRRAIIGPNTATQRRIVSWETSIPRSTDPSTGPLQKRTFARNYRQSITKIDSFIRERKLTAQED